MLNVKICVPATDYEDGFGQIDSALMRLGAEGLAAAPALLDMLADAGFTPDEEQMQLVIADILFRMLDALETDPAAPEIYTCLNGLDPDIAKMGARMLIAAHLPDGGGELSDLPDVTILCLAGLAHVSGRRAVALDLLRQARAQRPVPGFAVAAYVMRCWMLAIDGSIGSLWSTPLDSTSDMIDRARRDLDDSPLNPVAHHRLARGLAEADELDKALGAFMTALALPVGQSEKLDLGTDFAIFATYLRAHSLDALLDKARVRFSLTACPKVAAHAEARLASLEDQGALMAIGGDAVADIRGFLQCFCDSHEEKDVISPVRNALSDSHDDQSSPLPLASHDRPSRWQQAFIPPQPMGSFINLLLACHPKWSPTSAAQPMR